MLQKTATAWTIPLVLAFGSAAHAAPLVEDLFDYGAGDLQGQDGGTGWFNPWSVTIPSGVSGSIQVTEGSIAFSDYVTSGNKLTLDYLASDGFNAIIADRNVAVGVESGDVYFSYLYQRTDSEDTNISRTAEVRANDGVINFGLKAKGPSSQGVRVRYDGSDSPSAASTSIQDGASYLIVARFTNLGTTENAVGTLWAVDAAGFDAMKAEGITADELDANALLIATDMPTQPEDLIMGEAIQLVNATSSAPFTFDLDEFRIGLTLDDVLSLPEAGAVVGDADGDGDVDAFDLGIWQTQFGTTGDDLTADFDFDGDVDAFDLGLWQTNFGTGVQGAAVPEPAMLSLLTGGLSLLVTRRR